MLTIPCQAPICLCDQSPAVVDAVNACSRQFVATKKVPDVVNMFILHRSRLTKHAGRNPELFRSKSEHRSKERFACRGHRGLNAPERTKHHFIKLLTIF